MQIRRKMGATFWITVAGAVVAAGLAIYAAYVQENDKRKAEASALLSEQKAENYRQKAEAADMEIKALSNKAIDSLSEVKMLQEKLRERSEDLISLQRQNILEQTGGDYKPDFYPVLPSELGDIIGFSVSNPSNYPIYDIFVQLIDTKYMENMPQMSQAEMEEKRRQATRIFYLGTIPRNKGNFEFANMKIPLDTKNITYTFMVSWRNGSFSGFASFDRDSKGKLITKDFKIN